MTIASAKILVVDDDPAIRDLILRFLRQKDYQVESAEDGKSALEIFKKFNPDLVILDLNLPDINGYVLCEQMQGSNDVFVLMLTSRTDAADKIKGFSQGADDYLTKPFDLQELKYRVQAILRRQRSSSSSTPQETLVFDELTIDPVKREVVVGGDFVTLTALEFDLLYLLASSPGKAWNRSELIEKVWEYDYVGDQRVVDVHVGQIRKKIEFDTSKPSFIKTVRGIGYKFQTSSDTDSD